MKILRTGKVSQPRRLIRNSWTARSRGMKEKKALHRKGPDGDRLSKSALV
jgi:hypothetical protein